jgi:hypothetical protein
VTSPSRSSRSTSRVRPPLRDRRPWSIERGDRRRMVCCPSRQRLRVPCAYRIVSGGRKSLQVDADSKQPICSTFQSGAPAFSLFSRTFNPPGGLDDSVSGQLAHLLAHQPTKPCKSACYLRSRKPLRVVRLVEGSNPSPSAQPSASRDGCRCGLGYARFPNRRSQSVGVHGRPQKSTWRTRHWRTTGTQGTHRV